MNKMLTPKDVSDRIGLGITNTYKLIHIKGFPAIRIGKRFFVNEDDLMKYLKENRNSSIYLN